MTHNHNTAAVAYCYYYYYYYYYYNYYYYWQSAVYYTLQHHLSHHPLLSLCATLLLGWEDESGEEEYEGPPSCYGRRMRVRRGLGTTIIISSTSH